MKDIFDNVGKKMPYQESEEYLDQLIEQASCQAIDRGKPHLSRRMSWMIASAVATVVIVIGIGVGLFNDKTTTGVAAIPQGQGPIDEFLNTLTDEEVAMLPYYEIEEIPEY